VYVCYIVLRTGSVKRLYSICHMQYLHPKRIYVIQYQLQDLLIRSPSAIKIAHPLE